MYRGPVALIGLATGKIAALGELFDEQESRVAGSLPLSRLVIVFLVFPGSWTPAVLLALASLGKPLGTFRKVIN